MPFALPALFGLTGLKNILAYAMIAVLLALMGSQAFIAIKAISGAEWHWRAVNAEEAISTIDKTQKAVSKAEDEIKDQPIDKALAAKGWLRSDGKAAPIGLVAMPPVSTVTQPNHPATRVSSAPAKRAKATKAKTKRKPRAIANGPNCFFGICWSNKS